MCCVVEFENVFARSYCAEIVKLPAKIDGDLSNSLVICIALNFGQIVSARTTLIDARNRGARVIAYVFDSWNVKEYFYNKRRVMKSRIFSDYRIDNICDILFVPFQTSRNDFEDAERSIIRCLPLGVDTSLARGDSANRPISVLGYGRQPKDIDTAFGIHFNDKMSQHIYYHTSHMGVTSIHDFDAHRRFFWKIAQSSELAIAYDQGMTGSNAKYSIVGQRWFECLAAGCVVVGKRPKTPEVDTLLNWSHSTIELPDDPKEAIAFIEDLLSRTAFLVEVRERNVENIRSQHDWCCRIDKMLAEFKT